jgi:hypothetical protein
VGPLRLSIGRSDHDRDDRRWSHRGGCGPRRRVARRSYVAQGSSPRAVRRGYGGSDPADPETHSATSSARTRTCRSLQRSTPSLRG